jgi:hypothetical protein
VEGGRGVSYMCCKGRHVYLPGEGAGMYTSQESTQSASLREGVDTS